MSVKGDGRKWIAGECRLNLSSPTVNDPWRGVIRAAMNTWNGAGAKFKFMDDTAAVNSISAHDLGRWNGWIAMTKTMPQSGTDLTYVEVYFNLHYEWEPPHPLIGHSSASGRYRLETVVTHELGHALHLEDDVTPGANSVMKGCIKPGEVRTLNAEDEAGIRSVYP
jgi:hypothetical protein